MHSIGYSKSSRAKCHGPLPCKVQGSPIQINTLRYGRVVNNEYGETVQWRHWGCVTPSILVQLGALNSLDSITGFKDLETADKNKIRTAVTNKKVADADVSPTARNVSASQLDNIAPTNSRKRKAREDILAENRTRISLPSHPQLQVFDVEDDEVYGSVEARDELYCTLDTNVVGIQYYTGLVGSGEEVILQREPGNKYDANAIQVMNIAHTQVGHLPRNVAAKLSPLLDRGLITVEGVIRYTMSMYLKIFGQTDKRAQLEPLLVWATPGQRGFNTAAAGSSRSQQGKSTKKMSAQQQEALSKAAELKKMLDNLEKVDVEEKRGSLLDTLCATGDIFDLPVHPNPPGLANGLLTVDLLKHQQQGLQWCLEHENPVLPTKETDKPVQFWQMKKMDGKDVFYNVATKTPQQIAPSLGRGAIFADAMGLGKTLTMLALILATKSDIPREYSNSTLVVVPLSILSNWEHQIAEHCSPGSLSSCIYYGDNRSMDAEELAKHDVIITTYQVVAGEHSSVMSQGNKKKKIVKNLFAIQWKRVVLDEGHVIRNPKTKTAKAVCALTAQRRWILTGTPIINSPRDLGSLLTFLQICRPLDQEDFFKRLLLRPLKDGHPDGAELLKAMMNQVCIRRTKEMQDQNGVPLISLPPVDMTIIPVALNSEARELYDKIEALSKQRLEHYIQTNVMVQSNILSMLTRLRQIALHPALVPQSYIEGLRLTTVNEESSDASIISVSSEDRIRLEDKLRTAIEDCESCPICFSMMTEPRITACGHIFCFPCITESISRTPKCPMDRRTISLKDLYEAPPPDDSTQRPIQRDDENEDYRDAPSAKIDQLVRLLTVIPTTDKVLVFSQFTSFLNKIGEALEENEVSYVRFDGQMSAKRRQETLSQFSIPIAQDYEGMQDDSDYNEAQRKKGKGKRKIQNPKVMLISLKAGALGLNLTVANHVVLMDPWWQEGIESQAIDRVNRIGQTKDVHVYQLIAEDTVEQKVLEIQDRKKKLIQEAFSGTRRTEKERERKETRLQEMLELFGMRNAA